MHFQCEFTPQSPDDAAFRSIATLYDAGELGAVISAAEKTLQESPKHTNLYVLKLFAHHARQEFSRMAETAELLADLCGEDSTTSLLRGLAAFCNRRFEQATFHLAKSALENPRNQFTWLYLARTAFEQGHIDQAITDYRAALDCEPRNYAARSELSFCLQIQGRHLEAIEHVDALIKAKPSPELLMRKLKSVQYMCDFLSYRSIVPALTITPEHPMHPITCMALNVSAPQLRDNAIAFAHRTCKTETIPFIQRWSRGPKVRIGYFSADFHHHATMVLMGNAFSLHDRRRFDVVGFDYTGSDDLIARQTRASFDEHYAIHTLSDRSVAELAREKRIDIAIDLKGWTLNARPNIFQYRAAPIQINYLGFPGTSGMNEIDYIVADRIIIPDAHQQYYTEKVLYMPECYQINAREPMATTDRSSVRQKYDLSDDAFIFCSFNSTFKITPDVFTAWMRILEAVPRAILWLLLDNQQAQQNIRKEASRLGINPSRIVFAHTTNHTEHLTRLAAADLFLDSWFYTGHTTASDALWAGLPLVTLCGQTFASRVAASILTSCKLSEFVTYSPDEYINKAIELAQSPTLMASLRAKTDTLRTTSPLFDAQRWIRNFEHLLLTAVERYESGHQPAAIAVTQNADSCFF
jgi:protein O-GlcNAc transferase